jgi:DHA2 family multidrug resistance protein
MVVIAATLGAFMAFLDIAITNSSIRSIQASLDTSLDETAWITTSYLIAEISILPISGWLAQVFSPKVFTSTMAVLFVISSVACGASHSLTEMIVARVFQGLTGGALLPMASYLIVSTLPPKDRTFGLTIFASALSFAPAIGPSLGGWITYHYDWSYTFYLQVIPGAMIVLFLYYGLDPKPKKLHLLKDIDWLGIAAMAAGLGTLTFVLEEGNRLDWLGDPAIRLCSVIGVVATGTFVYLQLTRKTPFINLRLLARPKFLLCNLVAACAAVFAFGNVFLLPRFLIQTYDYNPWQIGNVMMWFGLPQVMVVPLIPFLVRRLGPYGIIMLGFAFSFASGLMNSFLSHDFGPDQFFWTQCLRAVGQPIIFGQLTGLAFSGMEKDMSSASPIFNMARTLAASVAIAGLGLVMETRYVFHFTRISETVTSGSPVVSEYLDYLTDLYSSAGLAGHQQALSTLGTQIDREAWIMAYSDCYAVISLAAVTGVCLMLILRAISSKRSPAVKS